MKSNLGKILRHCEGLVKNEAWFCFGLIILVLLGYGIRLSNIVIGKDHAYYYPEAMFPLMGQGRWGMALLGGLGVVNRVIPFWTDCLGVLILVFSMITWRELWMQASERRLSKGAMVAFSYMFLSYPLNHELFYYPSGIIIVGVGYLGVALCLCSTQDIQRKGWRSLFPAMLLLTFVIALYESFASVYVVGTLAIVMVQMTFGFKPNDFKTLKNNCAVLICAIVLRSAVYWILKGQGIVSDAAGSATAIRWGGESILTIIVSLCKQIGYFYAYNALFNHSILVFLLTSLCLLCVVVGKKSGTKQAVALIVCTSLVSSNFLLSVLQGNATPYRAAQSLALFVGVAWMIIYQTCNHKKLLRVLLVIIVVTQTKDFSARFLNDIKRFECDRLDFNMCGQMIEKESGRCSSPHVVFIGQAKNRKCMQEDITTSRLRFLMPQKAPVFQSAQYSLFALAVKDHEQEFYNLFRMFGFAIKIPTEEEKRWAKLYAETHNIPIFPESGSVVRTNDIVIVKLGDIANNRE